MAAKKKKLTKKEKRRIKIIIFQSVILFFAMIGLITTFVFLYKSISTLFTKDVSQPGVVEDFLTVNSYSRPGIKLDAVNGIVIHYTANPTSSAKQNRDYFENLRFTHKTKASSHYVIGLDGEILQIIPLDEMSYASNSRNSDTISIECCHMDESGKFNDATYESLVNLVSWLCKSYNLSTDAVIRHYDVTGKICPKYFVDNPDAWRDFLTDVGDRL